MPTSADASEMKGKCPATPLCRPKGSVFLAGPIPLTDRGQKCSGRHSGALAGLSAVVGEVRVAPIGKASVWPDKFERTFVIHRLHRALFIKRAMFAESSKGELIRANNK